MKYYQILKNYREDNDLTQKEISDYLNIGKNTYFNYENGIREMPFTLVVKLAKKYGISLDYIAGINTECKTNSNAQDEIVLLYNKLSTIDKGRIIGRIEEILDNQNSKNIMINQIDNEKGTVNINNK